MLNINNISKPLISGINEQRLFKIFHYIEKGDFIPVIGSNGAGKSTLLNIISGKTDVDEGRIILRGIDVTDK